MSEPNKQEQGEQKLVESVEHDAAKDNTSSAVPPGMSEERTSKSDTGDAVATDRSEATQQTQAEPNPAGGRSPEDAVESDKESEQSTERADAEVLAISRRRTRRSFLGATSAIAAGVGFYAYLNAAPTDDMQPVPLEDAYKFNESVSRHLLPQQALAPTYPLRRAETLRVNGVYGLKQDLVPESWRLQLVGMNDPSRHPRFVPDVTVWEYRYKAPPADEDKGHDTKVAPGKEAAALPAPGKDGPPPASGQYPPSAPADNEKNGGQGATRGSTPKMTDRPASVKSGKDDSDEDDNHTGRKPRGMEQAGESDSTLPPHTPGLLLELPDITRLPRVELVTQFKCIEGWSQIVHWAGVRMADFLDLYPPSLVDGKEPKYVYMETPDGDYYTGYEMQVMRHPQTLLVTEMMGAPLTQNHGAPLRLHMPTKYGYKQIKRIGLIAYTNSKPDDYWTKLGYDWYAGL